MSADIVNVTSKVQAFWQDRADERHLWSVLTSWEPAELAGQEAALGTCRILRDGVLVAEAHSTRALRPPKPGAQGMSDTRDAERVQTQAVGRALGLLGYAQGTSLEGDTDEPDDSGEVGPVMVPRAKAKGELVGALHGDTSRAAELWPFGTAKHVTRDDLDDLLSQVETSPSGEGERTTEEASTAAADLDGRSPAGTSEGDVAGRTPEGGADSLPDTAPPEGGPAAARAALKGKK